MTASLTLTPSQARFMQETKERRLRFAPKDKPPASPKPIVVEPAPVPVAPVRPWFSIIEEIDPPLATPSMVTIQRICAAFYEMTLTEMLSDRRIAPLVRARQVAMYLCKEFTLRSLPEIGRRFSGRDHTTVLHAVRRMAEKESYDKDLAGDLNKLRKLIREGC